MKLFIEVFWWIIKNTNKSRTGLILNYLKNDDKLLEYLSSGFSCSHLASTENGFHNFPKPRKDPEPYLSLRLKTGTCHRNRNSWFRSGCILSKKDISKFIFSRKKKKIVVEDVPPDVAVVVPQPRRWDDVHHRPEADRAEDCSGQVIYGYSGACYISFYSVGVS